MKQFVLLLSIFLLFASCNTQKSAQKKLEKIKMDHPQLFYADTFHIITNDTVPIPVPIILIDTIVKDADTVLITQDQVRLKISKVKEFIRIQGECLPDTIWYPVSDTIKVIKEEVVTKTIKVRHTPFIAKVGIFFFIVFILNILYAMVKGFKLY